MPTSPAPPEIIEPIVKLLAGMTVFFMLALYGEVTWVKDEKLFQVVATLLAGTSGSFFTRLKTAKGDTGDTGADGADGTPAQVNINEAAK